MNSHSNARAVAAALVGVMLVGTTAHALADIKNYRFEVVDKAMKVAPDAVITVKLVNTTTGKSVPDAVIFATRLDMEPEGMKDWRPGSSPSPAQSRAFTDSRRRSLWRATGASLWERRSRANKARSTRNSSSKPTNDDRRTATRPA